MVGLWVRGTKPKRVRRYEPDLSPSADLAYVAGFYLGDGKGAGNEHKVRFELADREQLEYVSGLVAKILGRAPKLSTRDGTFYVVDYDSVVLSNFLNLPVRSLVAHLKEFERDFLRGFADAEGYATCYIDSHVETIGSVTVGVANTNLEYLNIFKRLLSHLGIRGTIRRTNKKGGMMTIRGRTWLRKHDVYHLEIRGFDQVKTFHEFIGFRNATKAEKLADLVQLVAKAPAERYGWFTAHYRKEGRKWVKIRN